MAQVLVKSTDNIANQLGLLRFREVLQMAIQFLKGEASDEELFVSNLLQNILVELVLPFFRIDLLLEPFSRYERLDLLSLLLPFEPFGPLTARFFRLNRHRLLLREQFLHLFQILFPDLRLRHLTLELLPQFPLAPSSLLL